MEQGNTETMEHGNIGTREYCKKGTLEQWNKGKVEQGNKGTMEQRNIDVPPEVLYITLITMRSPPPPLSMDIPLRCNQDYALGNKYTH